MTAPSRLTPNFGASRSHYEMRMRLSLRFLVFLSVLSIGGCGGNDSSTATAPSAGPGSSPPPPPGSSPSYSTSFNATESPISEGGAWHRANNTLWTDVDTANGIAFGTNGARDTYDDSYALLSGFGPDQTATAVISRSAALNTSIDHEVELLLRFTDSATTAQGYECLVNFFGGVQIVRWNGALGDFTVLPTTGPNSVGNIVSGDVFKATIVGSTISVFVNDTLIAQAADSTYASGQPGIGFFTRPMGNSANFGITSYSVTSN